MIRIHLVRYFCHHRNCGVTGLRSSARRGRRPAGGRNAGPDEEPAGAAERYRAATSRRHDARLQYRARRELRSLSCVGEAGRRVQRHGVGFQAGQAGGARDDADDGRRQHEVRGRHQEAGGSTHQGRVRHLPSWRRDSGAATTTTHARINRTTEVAEDNSSEERSPGSPDLLISCLP